MIIVMPDGHPIKDPAQRSRSLEVFSKDLIGDVVPLIEKKYRTAPGRENRALAGLSMGGMQTLEVGLSNVDKFSYLGVFSAGVRDSAEFEKAHGDVLLTRRNQSGSETVLDRDRQDRLSLQKQSDAAGLARFPQRAASLSGKRWRSCLVELAHIPERIRAAVIPVGEV